MSFPRYTEYKDSGVAWLGEVPGHWGVDRLKTSILSSKNGIWGEEPTGDEDDTPCVRVADFDRQKLRVELTDPTIRNVTSREREGRTLKKGDLLLEKSGGGENQPVGCVVLYDDERPAVCSNFVARLQLKPGMVSSYWRYVHAAAYAVRLTTGSINQTSGIQNLDQDRYYNERAVFPPPAEQTAIATFLDRETAKIDALVAEQEKLIALLQEKRQAVISHAVTKGLDPNVPMKDSGVEWLGEVPEHWEVKRLKQLSDEPLKYGANEAAELDDPSLPRFVRITDVTEGGSLREETFRSLPREIAEPFLLKEGDVLLARSGGTVGKSFMYQRHWGEACFAGYLIRVRLSQRLCAPQWLNYFCRTNSYWSYVLGSQIQSTIQNVSAEKYANIFLPVPAIEEQQRVIECLDQATSKIDALVTEARTAITLLQERRTALISAAVTGQIDVRGLAGGANAPDSIAASAYTACAGG